MTVRFWPLISSTNVTSDCIVTILRTDWSAGMISARSISRARNSRRRWIFFHRGFGKVPQAIDIARADGDGGKACLQIVVHVFHRELAVRGGRGWLKTITIQGGTTCGDETSLDVPKDCAKR